MRDLTTTEVNAVSGAMLEGFFLQELGTYLQVVIMNTATVSGAAFSGGLTYVATENPYLSVFMAVLGFGSSHLVTTHFMLPHEEN